MSDMWERRLGPVRVYRNCGHRSVSVGRVDLGVADLPVWKADGSGVTGKRAWALLLWVGNDWRAVVSVWPRVQFRAGRPDWMGMSR